MIILAFIMSSFAIIGMCSVIYVIFVFIKKQIEISRLTNLAKAASSDIIDVAARIEGLHQPLNELLNFFADNRNCNETQKYNLLLLQRALEDIRYFSRLRSDYRKTINSLKN